MWKGPKTEGIDMHGVVKATAVGLIMLDISILEVI
jgi:hypothetical protein